MIYFVQVQLSALCLSAIMACLFGALVKPVFWVWYFTQPDVSSNDITTVDCFTYQWLSADLMLCHTAVYCDHDMTGRSQLIHHCSHFLCGLIFQMSDWYFKHLPATTTTSDCCCICFVCESFLLGTTSLHWIHFSSNDIIIVATFLACSSHYPITPECNTTFNLLRFPVHVDCLSHDTFRLTDTAMLTAFHTTPFNRLPASLQDGILGFFALLTKGPQLPPFFMYI